MENTKIAGELLKLAGQLLGPGKPDGTGPVGLGRRRRRREQECDEDGFYEPMSNEDECEEAVAQEILKASKLVNATDDKTKAKIALRALSRATTHMDKLVDELHYSHQEFPDLGTKGSRLKARLKKIMEAANKVQTLSAMSYSDLESYLKAVK